MSVPYTVFPGAASPSSRCPRKAAPWTELKRWEKKGGAPDSSWSPQSRVLSHQRLFQKRRCSCGSSALFATGLPLIILAILRNGDSPNYSPGLLPLFGLVPLP